MYQLKVQSRPAQARLEADEAYVGGYTQPNLSSETRLSCAAAGVSSGEPPAPAG